MAIQLDHVRYAYPEAPEDVVLNISEWSVSDGERVFVHGPSGSGKSTLLNLLSGMLVCREGCVSILGERLDKMSARQRDRFRANQIGYVFQQFNLMPYLNAIENIELAHIFSHRERKRGGVKRAQELLAALNIVPSDWYKPSSRLSIGQQQRVAIARALVNKPALLIADEPTSSLDQENRDNFMSVLMSLATENAITLLFVSHDMSLSRDFGRTDALADVNRSR
ncbi:MAG: ABC transporter ATP-binding protein [Halioglobus sp.]|nr:ABC transporter ATP-binding protein [Halioglobus sp.]